MDRRMLVSLSELFGEMMWDSDCRLIRVGHEFPDGGVDDAQSFWQVMTVRASELWTWHVLHQTVICATVKACGSRNVRSLERVLVGGFGVLGRHYYPMLQMIVNSICFPARRDKDGAPNHRLIRGPGNASRRGQLFGSCLPFAKETVFPATLRATTSHCFVVGPSLSGIRVPR